MVNKMNMPEMEKDFVLNCIVNDSERRIAGATHSRIAKQGFYRLKRTKQQRGKAIEGCKILAVSLV